MNSQSFVGSGDGYGLISCGATAKNLLSWFLDNASGKVLSTVLIYFAKNLTLCLKLVSVVVLMSFILSKHGEDALLIHYSLIVSHEMTTLLFSSLQAHSSIATATAYNSNNLILGF